MVQLNLLPDVKKEFLKSQKTKALVMSGSVLVTLGAVAITVLLFIYATFVQQIQINLISDDIKKKSEQVNSIQDVNKYLTIQNQLQALPQLHEQKGNTSRLFTFLPILNPGPPNNVKLSVLNVGTADRSLLLTGTTATYESLNVFVDTLSNAEITYTPQGGGAGKSEKMFSGVVVQSSGLARVNNATSVSFTVKVTYVEAALDVRNTDVKASVPNIETTQSLTNAPRALFEGEGQ